MATWLESVCSRSRRMWSRSSLTLAGESTSSPMTMFMGMAAWSVPADCCALRGCARASGKMPREWNAVSMACETCTCFFWSALAKA